MIEHKIEKDVKICYFQVINNKSVGYICAAMRRPPKNSNSTSYSCAFSYCHPKDEFSKKIARVMSLGRLYKDKTFKFSSESENMTEVFLKGIKVSISSAPKWVRKGKIVVGLTRQES